MNDSFEFRSPNNFGAFTIGEPGQRTFLLQAVQDGQVVTLKVEKQQVVALSEYLAGILADLPALDRPMPPIEDLRPPVEPAWPVGGLAVAYEQADDRILLVAEELVMVDEEDLGALDQPATARFHLTRDQVAGFIVAAEELVAAGRPPCQFCGQPLDPTGHACPRLN